MGAGRRGSPLAPCPGRDFRGPALVLSVLCGKEGPNLVASVKGGPALSFHDAHPFQACKPLISAKPFCSKLGLIARYTSSSILDQVCQSAQGHVRFFQMWLGLFSSWLLVAVDPTQSYDGLWVFFSPLAPSKLAEHMEARVGVEEEGRRGC